MLFWIVRRNVDSRGIFGEILRPRAVRVLLNDNRDILSGRNRPLGNWLSRFRVKRTEVDTARHFRALFMGHQFHSLQSVAGLIVSDFLEDQGFLLAHRLCYGEIHRWWLASLPLRGNTFTVCLEQANRDNSRQRKNHQADQQQSKGTPTKTEAALRRWCPHVRLRITCLYWNRPALFGSSPADEQRDHGLPDKKKRRHIVGLRSGKRRCWEQSPECRTESGPKLPSDPANDSAQQNSQQRLHKCSTPTEQRRLEKQEHRYEQGDTTQHTAESN